ncbi:hypothetical protein F4779DRAFT_623170 [Xylariaceae sp. FL0662B]|nr:hypothetical protein F4779DRAFT_623170 [Xylariaceae sp. FL0662B]
MRRTLELPCDQFFLRDTATPLRSFSHPLIRTSNTIAVLSESEFYVANQRRFIADCSACAIGPMCWRRMGRRRRRYA